MQAAVTSSGLTGSTESSSSAVNWGPVIAGAFAASALTFILMVLGSGLGLTMVSPWSGQSAGATTFAVSAAVWLVVVQWLSSGVGGYLTGRLRTKWVDVHTDETYFRDTAHGLLAWALATLLVVGIMGSAVSSLVGAGTQAVATVAAGAATGGAAGAAGAASSDSTDGATSYFVDSLFRPTDPARLAAPGTEGNAAAASEASRILINSAAAGQITDPDRDYLARLIAARAGIPEEEARTRVETVMAQINQAKVTAQEAADTARKGAATLALVTALSMIIGAFIAAVAAAIGGRQRDEEQDALILTR
jgi:hypothetical protein